MDVREKLVELLSEYFDIGDSYAYNLTRVKSAFACGTMGFDDFEEFDEETIEDVATHLIAHGVTVQEWISVKDERKPKQLQECLCVCQFEDDTKGEWRFYNVLKWHDVPYQDNGIVNRPHFTDEGVHGMVVTHWMPLPKLPQPSKGE